MDPKLVYLAQTDTTVGLLSQNDPQLAKIKKRASDKPFIKAYDSFKTLRSNIKIEKKHRKVVRRSSKTTFVVGQKSFRVVKDIRHKGLVSKFGWLYTTSANESSKGFNIVFAIEHADVVTFCSNDFEAKKPSAILRLLKKKLKKIRA